jgi:Spherulation-specific family 4
VPSNNFYVIYYGWLIAGESGAPNRVARMLAAAQPRILIGAYATAQPRLVNMSPQVRELLHTAGTQLFAYVSTDYGARDIGEVKAEATHYLANGVDGIFYDEMYPFTDDAKQEYCRQLYALAKDRGRAVVVNTGVAGSGERIMSVTDMLMVEHQWRAFHQTSQWRSSYSPERFMGTSSNEPGAHACLGYAIDEAVAARDTRAAWSHGIGWHYSTDRYVELPAWFSAYVAALGQPRG